MNIEIANKLQQMRKKNNLSQEELAAKMGVTRQAVSKWERAESAPDMENLILLAKLYGVTIDELLNTGASPETVSAGISLKKDDYGYTDDPVREMRPENYTEEEIFPNTNMNTENSIPQGAPFGADIDEEEKKASDTNPQQDDLVKNLEKAGRAIGDVINAAGQKLNETIKNAENADGKTEDWEVKFERGMEKFGETMEQFGEKMERKFGEGKNCCAEDDIPNEKKNKEPATLLDKLFPLLMAIVFCLSIPMGLAHIGWIAFLLIPMYYTTKEAIKKREPLIFCYPVFCVIVYVGVGLVLEDISIFGWLANMWWSTMWMLFVTIPIYYIVFAHFHEKEKNK
ncbi:MAG: helix-turn-helix domain-containing protein [Oscillospiraceae bacterium]|nr:helix-turn-helix domain-containing protein [Oscillospiraceae bacterium]